MRYLREPEPERGIRQAVLPGIDRIVAPNPSAHTYHGTNSFLIARPEGIVVLDPGPNDATHVAALLRETGGRVALILLTHTHPDHVGAVPALAAATGAPVAAYLPSALPGFNPDIALADGSEIAGMIAVHTPGHAADHLCFARPDGTLFSGDHVMAWSSSTVSPPGGDMAAYIASLDRLLARPDRLYVPAHGPLLPEPPGRIACPPPGARGRHPCHAARRPGHDLRPGARNLPRPGARFAPGSPAHHARPFGETRRRGARTTAGGDVAFGRLNHCATLDVAHPIRHFGQSGPKRSF